MPGLLRLAVRKPILAPRGSCIKPPQARCFASSEVNPMQPKRTNRMKVVVVYYSRFGAVKHLAELIAKGARGVEEVETSLLEVEDTPIEMLRPGESEADMARRRAAMLNELAAADDLIVGAPGYFGSMDSPL